jgi:hypothetical protein
MPRYTVPPGPPVPMDFFAFFLLFLAAFWGMALLLPRPWFSWLVKPAFQFLTDKLD